MTLTAKSGAASIATSFATSAPALLASDGPIGGGCLPKTLVRMADGTERPIEDVRPNEYVVTADGRAGMVRDTVTRRENDSTLRVMLRGRTPAYLASRHVVLTKRGDVAVRDLKLGDSVALTRYLPAARGVLNIRDVISPRERALKGGVPQAGARGEPQRLAPIAPIPDAIPLTPRKGRLIGLFLAYGSLDASKVRWTFVAEESDTLVVECADLLADLGIQAEIRLQLSGRVSVLVYGAAWARLWARLFGLRDDERTLHPLLFGNDDYLRAMLSGWVAGKGYSGRNVADRWQHMRGSTVSRTLALSLYDIGLGLAFRPAVRWCAPHENMYPWRSRPFYEIELVAPSGNSDNCHNGGESDQREDEEPRTNSVHVWSRVRGVEQCRYAGPVHSLNVDGEESYVAEGIGVRCSTNRGAAAAQSV